MQTDYSPKDGSLGLSNLSQDIHRVDLQTDYSPKDRSLGQSNLSQDIYRVDLQTDYIPKDGSLVQSNLNQDIYRVDLQTDYSPIDGSLGQNNLNQDIYRVDLQTDYSPTDRSLSQSYLNQDIYGVDLQTDYSPKDGSLGQSNLNQDIYRVDLQTDYSPTDRSLAQSNLNQDSCSVDLQSDRSLNQDSHTVGSQKDFSSEKQVIQTDLELSASKQKKNFLDSSGKIIDTSVSSVCIGKDTNVEQLENSNLQNDISIECQTEENHSDVKAYNSDDKPLTHFEMNRDRNLTFETPNSKFNVEYNYNDRDIAFHNETEKTNFDFVIDENKNVDYGIHGPDFSLQDKDEPDSLNREGCVPQTALGSVGVVDGGSPPRPISVESSLDDDRHPTVTHIDLNTRERANMDCQNYTQTLEGKIVKLRQHLESELSTY